MIPKEEILSFARTSELQPTTVEKDYALSWMLYGISKNEALSQWVFKGGTCLKKCYFETYRFSEDLDFTVPKGAIYGEETIIGALSEAAAIVYEATGIEIKNSEIEVEKSVNKKGSTTYTAKLTYSGPLKLASRQQQRIKFDITDDEIIVDQVDFRDVFHAYSDAPTPPVKIKCYSINEVLAEKTRALYERSGRSRDVYDVVNISRNFREDVDIEKARLGLNKKFEYKALEKPTVKLIFDRIDFEQLRTNWQDQLAHQVQTLPSVESFYNDLRPALSWWIDVNPTEHLLPSFPMDQAAEILPRVHFPESNVLARRHVGIGRATSVSSLGGTNTAYLDRIRYAARNRLCVEIEYHGIRRLVEPYSLRRPATGNLLLYIFELKKGSGAGEGLKAYNIAKISDAQITQQVFSPQYIVEL
jgi:predicted nucleotidyltransferase component of viral defense system